MKTMKANVWFRRMVLSSCAIAVLCCGCDQQETTDALKQAGETAHEAAETVGDKVDEAVKEGGEMAGDAMKKGGEMAGDAVKKGEQMASELGEKAMAYLAPMKEKFGDLDGLKDSPEKLKAAVTDLVQSIEEKSADIELPESVSSALETIKEKLVALKDYLGGEVEQAKIDEHLEEIKESVKSGLGMSDK